MQTNTKKPNILIKSTSNQWEIQRGKGMGSLSALTPPIDWMHFKTREN